MDKRFILWAIALSLVVTVCVRGDEQETTKTATLAQHETAAKFLGTRDHTCMGRTSLCPDRCGHSGTMAKFEVLKYLRYNKLEEFGDPKRDMFAFFVADNMKRTKVPVAVRDALGLLKKGDFVLLSWNHDYVTVNGVSGPERPIKRLEKIATIGTQEWLNQIDRAADVRDADNHGPTIGSDQWMQAVSIKLGVYDDQGHGPSPDTAEWRNAIQWKAFGIKPGS